MTRIGVLGAGQLGRMLALAGLPLGLRFRFLDPSPDPPAAALGEHVCAAFDDPAALDRFAEGLDVVTYEFEQVPAASVERLARRVPVRPGPHSLHVCADRVTEKRFVREQGFATAPFAEVTDEASLARAIAEVGTPAILKTSRDGYDGKGQARVRTPDEALAAWRALGARPCVLEGVVPFRRELAVLAVRGVNDDVRVWPLVETRHEGGVLVSAIAPAPDVSATLQHEAERLAGTLARALDHVGVLAIECFDHDGRLVVNELAPRVHNSGHWTLEGSHTSQFENHLRAVLGWPLGDTRMDACCGLVNVLGAPPDCAAVLALPWASLHLYDKPARPGRKIGHVTITATSPREWHERARVVEGLLAASSAAAAPGLVEGGVHR